MKTLTLKLKRDVLIVDGQLSRMEALELRAKGWKFLCQGTPTEEQAADLVESRNINYEDIYFDYEEDCWFDESMTSVDSFLSAISAKEWHWLLNPHEKELDSSNAYTDMFTIAKRANKYNESEFRTFKNPMIFIKE